MSESGKRMRSEVLRTFWRAHFTAWRASDLNQREYCEAHGLSLKQFGNWRAEFKYEDVVVERKALWRRGARVGHATSHAASHVTKPIVRAPVAPMTPATVAAETSFALRRRTFSRMSVVICVGTIRVFFERRLWLVVGLKVRRLFFDAASVDC